MSNISLDSDDPTVEHILKGHKKAVTCISFNPETDSHQFASSSEDCSLMVWNGIKNSRNYSFVGHTSTVTSLEFSPTSGLIASCSLDHTVKLWVPTITGNCTEWKAHLAPIQTLSFSPQGDKLITGARDKSLKLWDAHTKQFITSYTGHNNWLRCARFFNDGKRLATCADDKTVRIWDISSGKLIHCFTGIEGSPVHLEIHPNDNAIAVAMTSGSLRIYEMISRKLQQHYMLHDSTTCVSWHPKAPYLVTSGKDGKVHVVDVMEGRPIYTISGHKGSVNYVTFNPDGKYFASGGTDNLIMVWKSNIAAP